MLVPSTHPYQAFIDYLNSLSLTDKPCTVAVIPMHPAVMDENGDCGFAVYVAGDNVILTADANVIDEIDAEEKFTFTCENIAHEYVHHVQYAEGRPFDETEAEEKAKELFKQFTENAVRKSKYGNLLAQLTECLANDYDVSSSIITELSNDIRRRVLKQVLKPLRETLNSN